MAIGATTEVGTRLIAIAREDRLDTLIRRSREIRCDGLILRNPGSELLMMEGIVHRMARDAENGLRNGQKIAGRGTMGIVATQAIFRHGGMLVRPGSEKVGMAACAELIAITRPHPLIFMGIVAADATHCSLGHPMVGRVAESSGHAGMTFHAKLRGGIHIGKSGALESPKVESPGVVGVVTIAADQTRP